MSSYQTIAEKIHPTERVLDVGCGFNIGKTLINNLVGIDPAFPSADYQVTIEDYQPDQLFDVALCLGSINFGTEDVIARQIEKVVSCLNKRSWIYWRLNPGRKDHVDPACQQVDFFPWSFDRLRSFAVQHGYTQYNEQEERNANTVRLYAEWRRNS